jgi:uncharacterized lipoprotein
MRTRRAAVAAAALGVVLAGCGGGQQETEVKDADAVSGSAAADTSTCVQDAQQVATTPDGYPTGFPLPKGTVVFHVEDRSGAGVIATGVTETPFEDVLAAMNAAKEAGFRVTSGETEEDDAEADWVGHGYVGRWAIKKSATCPGETVVQLLSQRK